MVTTNKKDLITNWIKNSITTYDLINLWIFFIPLNYRQTIYENIRQYFYTIQKESQTIQIISRNNPNFLFVFSMTLISILGIRLLCYPIFYFIYRFNSINFSKINVIGSLQTLIFSTLTVNIPLALLSSYDKTVNLDTKNIPGIGLSFIQIMLCILISDFVHYNTHLMMHKTYLYKYHKIHHEHIEPTIFTDSWGSIIDYLISGVFPSVCGIILVSLLTGNMHFINLIMYNIIVNLYSISQHSNLNLPYSPLRLIPFTNSDVDHIKHHNLFNYNYGEFFMLWDHVFNTAYIEKKI
jgi:sterol desaturase/sphingolipid hydroxylase (fatty acid hydroxylase superfamily)